MEWSHGVEFWSGFWSVMESDFEFLSPFWDRIFFTDRQTATEWSGVRVWREPVG